MPAGLISIGLQGIIFLSCKNLANPSSIILSAEMMLRHMGWLEAADLVLVGVSKAILSKRVTGDFSSQMQGATQVGTAEFGDEIIKQML